jgi:lipopolysaccharide assembly outer membrane protein LptD (OstA)
VSRLIFFFLFLLFISFPVFADEIPTPNPTANVTANVSRAMTIEADKVNYLEENQFVDATGNVIFLYKNYTGTANHST